MSCQWNIDLIASVMCERASLIRCCFASSFQACLSLLSRKGYRRLSGTSSRRYPAKVKPGRADRIHFKDLLRLPTTKWGRALRTRPRAKRIVLAVTSVETVNGLLGPQLQSLVGAGWDVHIVSAPGTVSDDVKAAATVHFVPMTSAISPGTDIKAIVELRGILRRLNPQIIVGGTPKAGLISMIAGRLAGVPIRVLQLRGARWDGMRGNSRRLYVAADRTAAHFATDVLAVSNSLADATVEAGVCRVRPVVLGRGGSKGVDTDLFKPSGRPRSPSGPPRLGFVGRLTEDKGVSDALDVLSRVRSTHPDTELVLVGSRAAVNPVSYETLQRVENDPGCSWVGWKSGEDLVEVLHSFDLLVFPSRREGLPNAVIEAAACGVPTIGYDTTGVRDAVSNGVSGLLVPLGAVGRLADAALSLLAEPRPSRVELGSMQWSQEFSAEKVQGLFSEYVDSRVEQRLQLRGD